MGGKEGRERERGKAGKDRGKWSVMCTVCK